jgi:hypothetical protein
MKNARGQMLIVAVLLFLVILLAVPIMVFINRHATLHGIFSLKNWKGRSVAEAGIAYGLQQLSKPGTGPTSLPNWPFLGGTLPANGQVASAEGGIFSISYSAPPATGLQPYQVGILSKPLDNRGKVIPGASIFATVSQRTVGVKLPTGLSANSALDLMNVPQENQGATLRVEFGPIVVRDTHTWILDDWNNKCQNRRPRKFAAGAIVPRIDSLDPPNTDQKEYWAFTSAGIPLVIDTGTYVQRAQASTCPQPSCVGGSCVANPAGSCYFPSVSPGTATWTGTSINFTDSNQAIYIAGNVQLDNVTINLLSGALVTTGNLILGNNLCTWPSNANKPCPASGYAPVTWIRVPPTTSREDGYCVCSEPMCVGYITRHIDFGGFMYVGGNLSTLDSTNWTLQGVVRVDNTLSLGTNSSLDVFFNDVVSRNIVTSTFELQIDSTTAVP